MAGGFKRLMRKELRWKKLWFDEKYPTKFATTAWFHWQPPFVIYRVITFAYCCAILIWKIYSVTYMTSTEYVTAWFLSYPVWGFFLMVIYHGIALLCSGFNFDYDCLCNDDLRWYHKLCWILHEEAFNVTVTSSLGSMIYFISSATSNETGMIVTDAFRSNDICFYFVNAFIMMVDVFVCSISIRLLHVFYASGFFIIYELIHVYRWAAGYVPSHEIFYFGSLPAATTVLFSLITILFVIPFVHLLAYGIDLLRTRLITKLRARNKHELLRTVNSSTTPIERLRKSQHNQSSLRYKTSAFQTKRNNHTTSSNRTRTRSKMRTSQSSRDDTTTATRNEQTRHTPASHQSTERNS